MLYYFYKALLRYIFIIMSNVTLQNNTDRDLKLVVNLENQEKQSIYQIQFTQLTSVHNDLLKLKNKCSSFKHSNYLLLVTA